MRKVGYLLNGEEKCIIFLRDKSLLVSLEQPPKTILLRRTMFHLLEFILEEGNTGLLKDDDIMRMVWEEYGLKPSGPRLLQVVSALKKKLTYLGIEEHFILRVEGKGYLIQDAFYKPVYIRVSV